MDNGIGHPAGSALIPSPKIERSASKLLERRHTMRGAQSRKGTGSPVGVPTEITPFEGSTDLSDSSLLTETLVQSEEDRHLDIGQAVWSIDQEVKQESNRRRLIGEIHLPKNLRPTCVFPLFNILVIHSCSVQRLFQEIELRVLQYHVELLAPISHAFEPNPPISPIHKGKSTSSSRKSLDEGLEKAKEDVYASQMVEITTNCR